MDADNMIQCSVHHNHGHPPPLLSPGQPAITSEIYQQTVRAAQANAL